MTAPYQQTQVASEKSKGHLTHIPALDGVRALSICLVLAAHTLPLGPKFLSMNAMAGVMGMSLFFCLSGFLIVSMLQRNGDVISFLVRRLLRIVPSVVLYMLILVILFDISGTVVMLNLLFVANYATTGLVGGPLGHMWSLSLEVQFYIAIALIVLLLGQRRLWLVVPAAFFVTWLRIDGGEYANIKTHLRADEIMSGGILALVSLQYGEKLRRFFASDKRAVFALLFTALLWAFSCREDGGALVYLRAYLTAALVGIIIHCQWRPLLHLLESALAAYIARISYALYIYHVMMIYGWMNDGTVWERYLLKRPVSFVLTLAAAHASTFWWEERWQALARRMTQDRQPRQSAA